MKRVRRFAELFLERQAETVEADRAAPRGLERRRRIHPFVVAATLSQEERQRVRRHLRVLQEEVLPADSRERCELLLSAHARKIVRILAVEANQIVAGVFRQRHLPQKLRPREAAVSSDEAILAEMLLVEEHRRPELRERAAVGELAVALDLDAELFDQSLRRITVRIRCRDTLGAAVADEGAALVRELVALRVTAEVVVVVEHEDSLVRAERAAPEVRGRESGNTAADNDQVVLFVRVDIQRRKLTIRAALHRRERVDRLGIVSAQARERRRVVGG